MITIGDVLKETIPYATQTILKKNGIDISEKMTDEPLFDVVSVIGFSAEGLGGALGVAVEKTVIEKVYSKGEMALSDEWIGEVAKQLLGRLKNTLLDYGIVFEVAIPMVLHGLHLRMNVENSKMNHFGFDSGCGRVGVWIDGNWDLKQALALVEEENHAEPEGQLVMF